MNEIRLTLPEAMQRARECHRAGNLAEAQRLYQTVLDAQPDHVGALHLSGLVEHQLGHHRLAICLIDQALAINPDIALALNNRGIALLALNCHQEALESFDKALLLRPGFAEALNNRGSVQLALSRPKEALQSFERALTARPNYHEAQFNRGKALFALNRPVEALQSFDEVLAAKPNFAEALNDRGSTLSALNRHQEALESIGQALVLRPHYVEAFNSRGKVFGALNRPQDALASFEQALKIEPNSVEALYNRGNVLALVNRHEDALASYDRAISIRPDFVEAHNNRGNVLSVLDRPGQALASYETAVALKPDYVEGHYNRGNVLSKFNRYQEALESFDKALAVNPGYVQALINRGNVLDALNRPGQALASFDKALALKPDLAGVLNNRGNALLKLDRHELAIESYEQALAIEPNPTYHSSLIFAFNFVPEMTLHRQQAERKRWDEMYGQTLASSIKPHNNSADPNRRLCIGYVSSHFRSQASAYAFGGVLTGHDLESFRTVCYSDTANEDDITERLRARVDRWHRTVGMSDDDLAALVRADEVDILVDCVGHMAGHRLLVFARKPAPIQVTAWGEPTGTGLKAMDYLLADPILVPASERALLAEKVVDLPNFLGYWAPDQLPEPVAPPAVRHGYITFGSFNRHEKLKEPVLRCWAAILRALPTARLLLKWGRLAESGPGARIRAVMTEEGINPERVSLLSSTNRLDHFACYQNLDIALDPFPHGGGMTTLDALWMGVPVVTWAGRTISSRLAAANLTALELTDFIASDPESYVALAVAKASDVDGLSRLRFSLRTRLARSVIGDADRYTRAVEAAYRKMWLRWCADRACEKEQTSGSHI